MNEKVVEVTMDSRKVGRIALDKDGRALFEYDADWIRNGISISPFHLPLESRLFTAEAKPFEGNFGVFDDSLPDGWSALILDRYLRAQGKSLASLNLLEQLMFVGSRGRGALEYHPDLSTVDEQDIIDLDRIPDEERMVKSIKAKGKLYNEFKLMTVYDDSESLLGIFAFSRDITTLVSGIDQEQERQREISEVTGVLDHYGNAIDTTISDTDIRLVRYSPGSHTLTIYNGTDKIQHRLTQTRCMALVGEQSKRAAMRLLTDMDERADKVIEHRIQTALRAKGGSALTLYFKLKPNYDKCGEVKEYLGLLRDISQLMDIQRQMAIETAKVQEVENTKNSFVKNMVQDIKAPMNTVVEYVSQIGEKAPTDNEEELCMGIAKNADYLLHLIDNILYLSRLEARMVDIKKEPCNFAEIFEEQCATGWMKYKNAETRYIIENPYEQLTIDIDAAGLGHAIAQVAANAAQHTKSGVVKARYDYIGRRLIISIDDTGEGIPAGQLDRIKQEQPGGAHTTKGLGLAITKELISQMDGTLEIMSDHVRRRVGHHGLYHHPLSCLSRQT